MNIQKKLLLDSLNLSDNDIEDIKYSDDSIYITLSRQKLTCPCCGSLHLKSKGFYTRNIKTPNQLFACYSIHLRIRRYSCPECGHSFGDDKHLAPPHNSVSYNVIFEVMKLLRDSKMTFKQVFLICKKKFTKYCNQNSPVCAMRISPHFWLRLLTPSEAPLYDRICQQS